MCYLKRVRRESMDRHMAIMSLLALGGCAWFEDIKDTVEGVVNRNVVVGVVSTVDASLDGDPALTDQIDLDALGIEGGVVSTLFLADAASVADLDNAPISDADVILQGCGVEVSMPELSGQRGAYVYVPPGDIDSCDGPAFTMRRVDGTKDVVASADVPGPLGLTVPAFWDSGDDLTLSLAGKGLTAVIVVVMDTFTGDITYSNEPESVGEYYEFLSGSEVLDDVLVPGSAFEEETVHALLVTGLKRTPNRNLENANEVLSVVAGGRTELYPVSTWTLDTDALP
jgi:hypothetical protein